MFGWQAVKRVPKPAIAIRRMDRTVNLGTSLELLPIRGRTAARRDRRACFWVLEEAAVTRSAVGAIVEWDIAFHLASLYIR